VISMYIISFLYVPKSGLWVTKYIHSNFRCVAFSQDPYAEDTQSALWQSQDSRAVMQGKSSSGAEPVDVSQ